MDDEEKKEMPDAIRAELENMQNQPQDPFYNKPVQTNSYHAEVSAPTQPGPKLGVFPTQNQTPIVGTTSVDTYKKSSKGLWVLATFILLMLIALGGVAAAYFTIPEFSKFVNSKLNIGAEETAKTAENKQSANTTVYNGTEYSFSYNSAWKIKKMSEFLGTGGTGDSSSDPVMFMTDSELAQANQAVTELKNNPNADMGSFFAFIAKLKPEITVTYTATPKPSCGSGLSMLDDKGQDMCAPGYKSNADVAKTGAEQTTQTVCKGTDFSFSTDNPVIETRISKITVAGKSAYGVVGDTQCSIVSYDIFINTANGYLNIAFPVKDFNSLTADQKAVLDSLKIK